MLSLLRRWLSPRPSLSAEASSVDEEGRPILAGADDWWLELGGERIALLTDAQWAEMFWSSYLLVPVTEDVETLALLNSHEFWDQMSSQYDVVFRNHRASATASSAFPELMPPNRLGRIEMRCLYT